jgi:hypothetical protein
MRLLTAHKILISAAIVLALLLAVRAGFNYSSSQAKSEAASAAAGVAMAGILAAYLRAIWRRWSSAAPKTSNRPRSQRGAVSVLGSGGIGDRERAITDANTH